MSEEQTELLLKQYKPLIKRVLREAAIYENHINYDDYYQELCIKIVQIAENFRGDVFGNEKYQFTAYAHNGLNWYLTDLLRKDRSNQNVLMLSDITLTQDNNQWMSEDLTVFIDEVKKKLTEEEFILFKGIINNYTFKELADFFQVSKMTISKRKQKLLKKIESLKYLLL